MIVAETDQEEIDVSRQFFVIHLSIFKKKRGQSFSSKIPRSRLNLTILKTVGIKSNINKGI